LKKGQNQTNQL